MCGRNKLETHPVMKTLFLVISVSAFILFSGCQSTGSTEDKYFISDSSSITGLKGDSMKLVKAAGIGLKVLNVFQSVQAVSKIIHSSGGLVIHQNIISIENQSREFKISDDSFLVVTSYTPHAEIIARVPAYNLEDFMYSIANMGYFVLHSNMDTDDKSLDYLSNSLKQHNHQQFIQAGTNNLNNSGRYQRMDVKDKVIDQEITNSQINANVAFSTVQLQLFQNPLVRKDVTVNTNTENYQLSFSKNLVNALSAGWNYFSNFVLLVANLWIFIFTAVTVRVIIRYYKIKRKQIEKAMVK